MSAQRTERSAGVTLEKILEVAEHEFAREGFPGAHLQRIAEQVGVQKTALYYYFPSKRALYEAVLARMLEEFDRTISEVLARPGSPGELLPILLDTMNDRLAERRNYSQILVRIFVDRVPLQGDEVEALVVRVIGRLLRYIRSGMDAGEFVRRSSRHLLQSMLGMVVFHYATGESGAQLIDRDDLFTREAVAWRRLEVRRLAMRAILVNPPEEPSAPRSLS